MLYSFVCDVEDSSLITVSESGILSCGSGAKIHVMEQAITLNNLPIEAINYLTGVSIVLLVTAFIVNMVLRSLLR